MITFFIFAVKDSTDKMVHIYNTNNTQAVDYTMFMPIKKRQCEELDRLY